MNFLSRGSRTSFHKHSPGRLIRFRIFDQLPWIVEHQIHGISLCHDTSQISESLEGLKIKRESQKNSRGNGEAIRELCKEGRLKKALQILDLNGPEGIQAYSGGAYASLLQACAKLKALTEGKQIHAHISKAGFEPDIFLSNTLISMYAKCRSVVEAREVFDKMPQRDIISWNAVIAGYAQNGFAMEAWELFAQMQQEGFQPNKITCISILTACSGSAAALKKGKQVHAYIVRNKFEADVSVGNALISMYSRCGSIADACQVFDKMHTRDVVSYNAMVAAYADHGHGRKALDIFWQLEGEGIQPDKVSFMSILNVCDSPAALRDGKQIHAFIVDAGFESDISIGTALVSMYARCGSVLSAQQVFDTMPTRDVIAWNAMIAGYAQQGHTEEAFEVYCGMWQAGLIPNTITYLSILSACDRPETSEPGEIIHTHIEKSQLESHIPVGNALVSMYARCGNLYKAEQVFNKMQKRDVVSWNAIIAAYSQHGHLDKMLELFYRMQRQGMEPDKITFSCILGGCIGPEYLEEGKKLHAHIARSGVESDVHLGNSLISMYARCGSVAEALQVFNRMLTRDVVSWNSMIAGCVQHGQNEYAVELFRRMQQEGVKPDHVSFVSVLNAFTTPTALELGKLVQTHIVKQGLDSDVGIGNALINMFSRCGSPADARQVLDRMPKRDVLMDCNDFWICPASA